MKWNVAAALLLLSLTVAACAPASSRQPAPVRSIAAGLPTLLSPPRDIFHALLANSRDLGPLSPARPVSFLAVLRAPAAQQAGEVAALYNPRARTFGHFQTPQNWAQRFAPSPTVVDHVRSVLARAGISVIWQPGSGWLSVRGPAAAIERVFGVRIHAYLARSGKHFYAAAHDPIVPAVLTRILAGTGHLSSYQDRTTHVIATGGLRPADLRTAYDLTPLVNRHLDGSGQTISFIEIDGYYQSDLNAFTQRFGLPPMHPTIGGGGALSNVDGEAELDLEVAHEIAPAAKLVLYNCAGSCSNNDIINLETQAVRQRPRGIISISIGGCEKVEGSGMASAERSVFSEADALGESVFAASGDDGAYTCLDQNWGAPPSPGAVGVSAPASDPGVTAVGGTSLSLNPNGTWYREEAWENPPDSAGSGGGVSAYYPRPPWQRGPGTNTGYDSSGNRQVPDISADADPVTGAQVIVKGNVTQVGGTSQATPIWAGMTALIDQYLHQQGRPPAGFLNPALYALAATKPSYPPLHDITLGTNLVYPATPGYDLASGLGTPDGWNLARDLLAYQQGRL